MVNSGRSSGRDVQGDDGRLCRVNIARCGSGAEALACVAAFALPDKDDSTGNAFLWLLSIVFVLVATRWLLLKPKRALFSSGVLLIGNEARILDDGEWIRQGIVWVAVGALVTLFLRYCCFWPQ